MNRNSLRRVFVAIFLGCSSLFCSALSAGAQSFDASQDFTGLPPSEQLEAADLDGDGNSELLVWNQKTLKVFSLVNKKFVEAFGPFPSAEYLAGAPWAMSGTNLRSNTKGEFLVGFGYGRGEMQADIRLYAMSLRDIGGKSVLSFDKFFTMGSSRPQPVALLTGPFADSSSGKLFFAYFNEKYFVQTGFFDLPASPKAFEGMLPLKPFKNIRMATQWASADFNGDGRNELVVGRPYGDDIGKDGDLRILDGAQIKTLRGVQGLTTGRSKGKDTEIFFGDGWHQSYAKEALGRLCVAEKGPDGWVSSLIEHTTDQYSIGKIKAFDLDKDGKDEILAVGNLYIKLYWRGDDDSTWMSQRIGDGSSFTLATFRGDPYAVVPGGRIYKLKNAKLAGEKIQSTKF